MNASTYTIIGLAMETHNEIGPGLKEIFYHELLRRKLIAAGVPHQFKPKACLTHRGIVVDTFQADLLVADELAVELKVLWETFNRVHLLQLICYLKFWNRPIGLLLDFGKESLKPKRLVYSPVTDALDVDSWVSQAPTFIQNKSILRTLGTCIDSVLAKHGLGYRDVTYGNLLAAEITSRGEACLRQPKILIKAAGICLGEDNLNCLLLPGHCAVLVTALRDLFRAADRAILQTYLRHLDLPWGVVLNFGKRKVNWQFVVKPRPLSVSKNYD